MFSPESWLWSLPSSVFGLMFIRHIRILRTEAINIVSAEQFTRSKSASGMNLRLLLTLHTKCPSHKDHKLPRQDIFC